MIQICLYFPVTGEVRLRTSVPDLTTAQRLADHEGLPYIEDSLGTLDAYVVDGALHPKPLRPSPEHLWDPATLSWVSPSLESSRLAKINQITRDFEKAAESLTAGYPSTERLTWPVQQSEALAWEVEPNTPTPYLDGLALARGISKQEMRTKTVEVVREFLAASQYLVGTRQRLRDAAQSAATAEDLQAIRWPA